MNYTQNFQRMAGDSMIPDDWQMQRAKDEEWNMAIAQRAQLLYQDNLRRQADIQANAPTAQEMSTRGLVRDYGVTQSRPYSYSGGQVFRNGQAMDGTFTEQQYDQMQNEESFSSGNQLERALMGRDQAGLNKRLINDPRFSRLSPQQMQEVYQESNLRSIDEDLRHQSQIENLNLDVNGNQVPSVRQMRDYNLGYSKSFGAANDTKLNTLDASIAQSQYVNMANQFGLPTGPSISIEDRARLATMDQNRRKEDYDQRAYNQSQLDNKLKRFSEMTGGIQPAEAIGFYDPEKKALVMPNKGPNGELGEPTVKQIPLEIIDYARRLVAQETGLEIPERWDSESIGMIQQLPEHIQLQIAKKVDEPKILAADAKFPGLRKNMIKELVDLELKKVAEAAMAAGSTTQAPSQRRTLGGDAEAVVSGFERGVTRTGLGAGVALREVGAATSNYVLGTDY